MSDSKRNLTVKCRSALESALVEADFLNASDISILQALCLYLTAIRCYDGNKNCWAITGLVTRIAQGMGLHRDGTYLGLSPFEVEMRRRVWWAIIVLDLRCAEENDSELAICDSLCDTKIPLNINDTDMTPTSKAQPAMRIGRSDCAAALVRYKANQLFKKLLRPFKNSPSTSHHEHMRDSSLSIDERVKLIDDTWHSLNVELLRLTDIDDNPQYLFVAIIARILISKAYMVTCRAPGSEMVEMQEGLADQVYLIAVETIECNQRLLTNPMFKQFRWICATYFNWRPMAHVLLKLSRDPWTIQSERGWRAVNGYECSPVRVARITDRTALFLPLRKLFIQARRHRDAEIARLRANVDETWSQVNQPLTYSATRTNDTTTFGAQVSMMSRFGLLPGEDENEETRRIEEVRKQWMCVLNSNNNGDLNEPHDQQSHHERNISDWQVGLDTQGHIHQGPEEYGNDGNIVHNMWYDSFGNEQELAVEFDIRGIEDGLNHGEWIRRT